MRSIAAAALWMIAGFGFTEFVADLLQTARVENATMVAQAAEPQDMATLTHFFQPASYRPGWPVKQQ